MIDFKCAKSYVCFTLLTCLMLLLGGCLQVHPFRGRRHIAQADCILLVAAEESSPQVRAVSCIHSVW